MTEPSTEETCTVTCTVETVRGGPAVVTLAGELDIASVPTLRERLLNVLRPDAGPLVIDMSAVRYADASGLAVLVSTKRRAVLLGGTVRLAALQPAVARVLAATGLTRHLAAYPTVQAAIAGRKMAIRAALHVPSQAGALAHAQAAQTRAAHQAQAVQAQAAQAQAVLSPDSGELRAAVGALLEHADAWRDADPHRRFAPALRALTQAHAGSSYAAMTQAAQSLLSVLGREPLTYSPAVAATASRLRRLFSPRTQLAMG